ncbi:hypothetical protein Dimus_035333 [Dionaea muscipula]
MTVLHLKKKDIVKSSVKGVAIEFDHDKLASILGAPRKNGISLGVSLVDKKGEEPKRYDYFEETFLTMCKLTREDGIWWVGTGENRRRDDDDEAPEAEAEEEEKDQTEFDWEAVIDEAAEQGESRSDDQFFDAQVDVEEPVTETQAAPAVPVPSTVQQKVPETTGVDPSCPSGHIPEAVMNKLQAEFERARANDFKSIWSRLKSKMQDF